MNRSTAPGVVFIALGVVFIAVGSSGQRAFLGVGLAFLIVGFVYAFRQRRAGELK